MNKFENSGFENLNETDQTNTSGVEVEKVNERSFNMEGNKKSSEEDFDGENIEEMTERNLEQSFVDLEEELTVIDNALLEELSIEEKERLEQDKVVLEAQLQQKADSLVEKEKLNVEQEIKEAIQEKLIEEIKQLQDEGKLENLTQELSSDKPAEIDNEGSLKEIAKKDPKTALEIIDQYLNLKGSQNLLESIKFGYDVVTVLLEKWFKEEKEEMEGDLSSPDQLSPEEKTGEKIDIFQEIAEQRVSDRVEEEREVRREPREKEVVLDSQPSA